MCKSRVEGLTMDYRNLPCNWVTEVIAGVLIIVFMLAFFFILVLTMRCIDHDRKDPTSSVVHHNSAA